MPRPCLALSFLIAILFAVSASAEETYFQIPLVKLSLTEGQLPGAPASQRWDVRQPMRPYMVLDGSGEAYAVMPAPISPFGMNDVSAPPTGVAIRTPQSGEVTGRLFLAKSDGSGMIMVRFKVAADAFRLATRLDPSDGAAEADLGVALYRLGRIPEAIDHERAALALDPSLADARSYLRVLESLPRR